MNPMLRLHRAVFASVLCAAASFPVLAVDLAPTGTLRAAFLGDNPVQGRVDKQTGAISGPVADLVKEFAHRLGVPYKIIPASGAREVMDLVKSGQADIGFLAWDETRAREVDFSEPYARMHNAYLVPASSPIKKSSDADRKGVKIGAVRGQTQQIFLSEHIKNATVRIFESTPSQQEMSKMLASGELDVFGANRQRMEEAASKDHSLRALADDFSSVEQAVVVSKQNAGKLPEINRFLVDVRKSGFVKDSLAQAKLIGVDVAEKYTSH